MPIRLLNNCHLWIKKCLKSHRGFTRKSMKSFKSKPTDTGSRGANNLDKLIVQEPDRQEITNRHRDSPHGF